MARAYLAVAGEDDPRYDDLLRGMLVTTHPAWPMLRAALFTRCEQAYGEHAYVQALDTLLHQLSAAASPQRLLVAGHMRVAGGHAVVGR